MKFQVFLEVAMAIHEKFRIIPMLYGSLGLEQRLNINFDENEIDILVPERYLTKYWEKLYDLMIKIGFQPYDLYNHSFVRCEFIVNFSAMENVLELLGISKSKIPLEKSLTDYYLLDAENYLKVYKMMDDHSEHIEKINAIENKLKNDEIHKIKSFVQKLCETEHLTNDYTHYVRVSNMAAKLAGSVGANDYVCALSALLYDLDSIKSDNKKNYTIDKLLKKEFVTADELGMIKTAVAELKSKDKPKSKEGKCLSDAYNLDFLGAVGIAMGFIQNAKKDLPMYPLDTIPVSVVDDEYRESRDALEHFAMLNSRYKNMFYTNLAKSIANKRVEYMQSFLYQFYDECDCLL